jgi:hypothetical protein
MGKIYASYLLKVHLHNADDADATDPADAPTLDEVKDAVIEGLKELTSGDEITISLAERTDD